MSKKSEGKPAAAEANGKQDTFYVEKVLKKRTRQGRPEYFIKWVGYAEEHNTWEPEANLASCPEYLTQFEERLKANGNSAGNRGKRKLSDKTGTQPVQQLSQAQDEPNLPKKKPKAAENGAKGNDPKVAAELIPETILGATDTRGELMFLIRWKNKMGAELVPARIANEKFPQLVIQFYEERLTW